MKLNILKEDMIKEDILKEGILNIIDEHFTHLSNRYIGESIVELTLKSERIFFGLALSPIEDIVTKILDIIKEQYALMKAVLLINNEYKKVYQIFANKDTVYYLNIINIKYSNVDEFARILTDFIERNEVNGK